MEAEKLGKSWRNMSGQVRALFFFITDDSYIILYAARNEPEDREKLTSMEERRKSLSKILEQEKANRIHGTCRRNSIR